MAWNGNNNRGRPFIEVNFGRPNPPQPVVEVDIIRPGGYSGGGGYSRPMVEVDVFGSSRGPPPPPQRPMVEVDIMRPQYPGYASGQTEVVVTSGGQNRAPYGQQNGGYPSEYGYNNGDGYGRNPYGNNYPPQNNFGW